MNILVTAPWRDLLSHLRLALGLAWHHGELRQEPFTFRLVTDEEILRASLARDRNADVYEAAVGQASLVVVRLGFLGWKNQAAPGYLHEALMRCVDRDHRPVWLTDTPTVPFEKGHLSWSEDVRAYVAEHFEKVTL